MSITLAMDAKCITLLELDTNARFATTSTFAKNARRLQIILIPSSRSNILDKPLLKCLWFSMMKRILSKSMAKNAQ
jgi:hypothetical protein